MMASGTPLLQVDTAAVARRVAAIESVESARVQRSYPSALTITVVERRPVVRVIDGRNTRILDRLGVAYLTYADGRRCPRNWRLCRGSPPPTRVRPTRPQGRGVRGRRSAVYLSRKLLSVNATSPVDIRLTLTGDRR